VRSIFSLVSLIKNFYDLYIITSNCDLGSNEEYKNVKADTLFEKDGVHYYYFSKSKMNAGGVTDQINKINPQLIYLNSFWSYNFSIGIIKAKNNNLVKAPLLLAPRGMLGKGALSLKSGKKILYLLLAKMFNWYAKVTFHATNEQEKIDILKRFKKAKVLLAPNLNSGTVYAIEKTKDEKKIKLFYLSRIAKVKNLHFALEVLSSIPKDLTVEYDIFGNIEDKDYWKLCESIIQKLPANVKVNYKGELAFNEVQAVIVNYHALFLPTLNENFGHSIVESLLCGCPVVTSDQTPWNDMEKHGAGYALDLENKNKFVEVLSTLALLNNSEYKLKSEQAIKYISHKLNINESIKQYKDLFNESTKN